MGIIAALFMLLGAPGVAHAVPVGNLDPTFSGDGIVRNVSLANLVQTSVQVDAQGRVIVGGSDSVLRYKANGALDPTWKPYHFRPGYGSISAIALSGTKTLVSTSGNGTRNGGSLVRLMANGSLDMTFGVNGVLGNVGGCPRCGLSDVVVATTGEIFATSASGGGGEGAVGGALIKVAADGSSIESTYWFPTEDDIGGVTPALTLSGQFVYVPSNADTPDGSGPLVARFLLDGALDTNYGTNGYAFLPDGGHLSDIAVSPTTGQVTVIGWTCVSFPCSTFVSQLTGAGVPDPTFQGQVYFGSGDPSSSQATAVALQSGGVVIAGVDRACHNGTTSCFGVERLTPTGTFDTSFAGTGYVHTLKAPASASDIRIFNTKIVVSGGQYVARYQG